MDESDVEAQLERAGIKGASVDSDEVQFDDASVTGEDLMSADLDGEGVPREVIEDAIASWEADRKYEEEAKSLRTRIQERLTSMPDAMNGLRKAVYRWPSVPAVATVTDVDGVTDGIKVRVEVSEDETDNMRREARTFTLDADGLRLRHLLSVTGSEQPSELEGKTVPIKCKEQFKDLNFNLDTPRNRTGWLPLYYLTRAFRRGRAMEVKTIDHETDMFPNRNAWLIGAAMFASLWGLAFVASSAINGQSLAGVIASELGMILQWITLTFMAAYAVCVIGTVSIGVAKGLFGDRR